MGNRESSVNQLEHVVEDEIAAVAVGLELEDLGVVHRSFFFVDLCNLLSRHSPLKIYM